MSKIIYADIKADSLNPPLTEVNHVTLRAAAHDTHFPQMSRLWRAFGRVSFAWSAIASERETATQAPGLKETGMCACAAFVSTVGKLEGELLQLSL